MRNAGINFSQHATQGIDHSRFGELLTMSGLVLNPSITWITFHGLIDVAFLLHILTGCDLPEKVSDFTLILTPFFPCLFDIKLLLTNYPHFSGSLLKIAKDLQLKNDNSHYQSADESRLTIAVFFKIRELLYKNVIDESYNGRIFYLQSSRFFCVCSRTFLL